MKDKCGTGECYPFKAERSKAKFIFNLEGILKKTQEPNEIDRWIDIDRVMGG